MKFNQEQQIAWNWFRTNFAPLITVDELYYQGTNVGSEFLVYNANKLYFALKLSTTYNNASTVNFGYTELYNELNALILRLTKAVVYWDVTAAGPKYYPSIAELNNCWFSRLLFSGVVYMQFVGFRITI